jgi:hypothetical protein
MHRCRSRPGERGSNLPSRRNVGIRNNLRPGPIGPVHQIQPRDHQQRRGAEYLARALLGNLFPIIRLRHATVVADITFMVITPALDSDIEAINSVWNIAV